MAIPSPRADSLGSRRQGVPIDWYSEQEHRRKLAELLNLTSEQLQDLVEFVRDQTSVALYGSMYTSGTSGNYNLVVTYTTYTDFNAQRVTDKGTIFNTSTNSFQINANGIYVIYFGFSFQHNESNSGRTFNVRFLNTTDTNVIGDPITVGVGRNTPTTNFSYQFMVEIDDTNEDKDIVIQLGGGAAVNGTFDSFEVGVYSVGELRGTAGDLINPADSRYD